MVWSVKKIRFDEQSSENCAAGSKRAPAENLAIAEELNRIFFQLRGVSDEVDTSVVRVIKRER